jgi:hypothetical protein
MVKNNKSSKTTYLLSAIIAILGFIFCLLACYPGFTSPDSLDQYQQAKAGVYSDWHPPIIAWLWNKLLWINDGPLPMLLLNNLLYWIGVAIIAIKFNRLGFSLFFLLLSFSPPLINFIGIIWKDTFLFSLLFFVCAILFSLHNNQLGKPKRLVLFLIIITLSFLAIMIRHNAASALVPILGLSLNVLFKNIKPFIAFFAGLLIAIVLFYGGQKTNSQLCNYKSQHPEQQLMLYDLLGISQQVKINLFPEYLKNKVNLDTINRIYNDCDGGMSLIFAMHCVTENPEQLNSIKNAWKDAVLQYPKFVLKHKYKSFCCLQKKPLLVNYSYIDPEKFDSELVKSNIFKRVFRDVNESELSHKFYVPNNYLLGCLAISILSLLVFWKTKNQSFLYPLFLSLSGFFYSASYFLLSPCNELRYNYWTIGAFFLSIVFLLNILINEKIKKHQHENNI